MKRSGSGTSNYRRIQRRRYHGRRQNPVPVCSLHCLPHMICSKPALLRATAPKRFHPQKQSCAYRNPQNALKISGEEVLRAVCKKTALQLPLSLRSHAVCVWNRRTRISSYDWTFSSIFSKFSLQLLLRGVVVVKYSYLEQNKIYTCIATMN